MSRLEIEKRLAAGELPAALCKEAWERKLEVVLAQDFDTHRELEEHLDDLDSSDYCSMCFKYYDNKAINSCEACTLVKMDARCSKADGPYDRLTDAEEHDDLVAGIKDMITLLDKAIEFERQAKLAL